MSCGGSWDAAPEPTEAVMREAYGVLADALRLQELKRVVMSLEERQAAAIEELIAKMGYLPEAHAILERHGLR